jgi:phosphoserine phosphatase
MKFAVYDLDQTLLPVDSCDTWNSWLVHRAGMDEEAVERRNREFYDAYEKGTFDIDAFETFILGLLAKCRRSDLDRWMDEYLDAVIRPAVRPEALELVKKSESEGYVNVLATGTHRFISQPIAGLFGFRHLVAATPEVTAEGEFTGRLVGGHSFAEGKLRMVREFVDGYAARAGGKAGARRCVQRFDQRPAAAVVGLRKGNGLGRQPERGAAPRGRAPRLAGHEDFLKEFGSHAGSIHPPGQGYIRAAKRDREDAPRHSRERARH